MAELTVWFSEDEWDALLLRAAAERRSVERLVHDTALAAIDEHAKMFYAAADHVLHASAKLNRRLT